MSEPTTNTESKRVKQIDPTLDITSEHFDPLKALYSDEMIIPYKNAKVYDNISKYESAVRSKATKKTDNQVATTSTKSTSNLSNTRTNTAKVNKFSASDEPVIRRFLPHQRKAFSMRKINGK